MAFVAIIDQGVDSGPVDAHLTVCLGWKCKLQMFNGLLALGRLASDFSTLVLTRLVDL